MTTDPVIAEQAVTTAFGRLETCLDRETVERVGARLLREDPAYRRLWLRNSRVARSVEMAAWLTAKGESERFRPAAGMVETARLAVQVAESLDVAAGSRGVVAACRARAWAGLGNAERLAGRLTDARWAFGKAAERARETGGPEVPAEISLPLASLLRASGSTDEAHALCEESLRVFEATGAERLAAKALVSRSAGLPTQEADPTVEDVVLSLELATAALRRNHGDPILAVCATHNVGRALVMLGHPRSALACFRHVRPVYERFAFDESLLKVQFLEGVAAVDLGRYGEGIAALRRTRAQALEEGSLFWEHTADRALDASRALARLAGDPRLPPADRERTLSALTTRLRWSEYPRSPWDAAPQAPP